MKSKTNQLRMDHFVIYGHHAQIMIVTKMSIYEDMMSGFLYWAMSSSLAVHTFVYPRLCFSVPAFLKFIGKAYYSHIELCSEVLLVGRTIESL